ncbi:MAG TPA: hypothetical protein VK698_06835 [Kofleriaceae bacterium]|nr:hypothetical protein [Kofleriaceae bacterium]
MRFDSRLPSLFLCASLAGSLGACSASDADDDASSADADEIAAALELDNGGFTMDDEAPQFGDEDGFAAAELEDETDFDDPMDRDPAVDADRSAPDAAIYHAAVLWGQMPADLDAEVAFDWSGTLSINRGAMIIRRVVAFEDETDAVDPRTDRRTIHFTSVTRPHADGFRLTIVDPQPESADPLVLTYTPDTGTPYSVEMTALLDGPQSDEVDELGNRLVAVAMREPVDVCETGFLRGRWHRVRDGRGRFLGEVTNADGDPVGHLRGVYGQRRAGEKVFFGKFIDRTGRFRGLLGGNYGDGHFRGRWLDRGDPERGVLAGEYRENEAARGIGGHFLGRWAEKSCDIELER